MQAAPAANQTNPTLSPAQPRIQQWVQCGPAAQGRAINYVQCLVRVSALDWV